MRRLYRDRWHHLYDVKRKRIPPTPNDELRLHRLERPLPWDGSVWPTNHHLERYPDYPPLIRDIAQFNGVREDEVVLGQGIEDLIRTLVLLSCGPGDGFAFTWPTCAMFEMYSQIFDVTPVPIVTDPDRPPDAADVASYAGSVQLLLLPNPGQPVETCYSTDDLRHIADMGRRYGTIFAIDEAYYGFGAPTALPLIREYDNVVVLRTFSKAFGAAGIRVGYAMGQEAVIKPLEAIRTSGEISGLSLRAATRLLMMYESLVEPGVKQITEGRDWLVGQLRDNGFWAKGEHANHVLIKMKNKKIAADAVSDLKQLGVNVKGEYPSPLDRHLLVTAGPVPMMQQFMDAFLETQKNKKAA